MTCEKCGANTEGREKLCETCEVSTSGAGVAVEGHDAATPPAAGMRIDVSAAAPRNDAGTDASRVASLTEPPPKYICPQCEEEFAKGAKVPPSGIVGRYAPKCPKGHRLTRVFGFWGSLWGWGILVLLVINVYRFLPLVIFTFDDITTPSGMRLALRILLWIFVGMIVLCSIGGVTALAGGLRARSKRPPMNRLSKGSLGAGFGSLLAVAISIAIGWNALIRPVDLYLWQPAIGLYAVEGTVTVVSKLQGEDAFVYDFKETSSLRGYAVEDPPKVGERVWVLGRGYVGGNGYVTLLEIFRRSAPKKPSADPTDDLVQAVEDQDAATVKTLLNQGVQINAIGRGHLGNKWTPLQAAVWNGDFATVKLLIEKGADARFKGWSNTTALHNVRTNPDVVKYLVANGADVNSIDGAGNTPLHEGVSYAIADPDVDQALISLGSDVNARNRDGETPLVRLLKENVKCDTTYGEKDELPVVSVLLKGNTRLDMADTEGDTALSLARATRQNCKHPEGIAAADQLLTLLSQKP